MKRQDSFMYQPNKNGSTIELCGTPLFTETGLVVVRYFHGFLPFLITFWCLFLGLFESLIMSRLLEIVLLNMNV